MVWHVVRTLSRELLLPGWSPCAVRGGVGSRAGRAEASAVWVSVLSPMVVVSGTVVASCLLPLSGGQLLRAGALLGMRLGIACPCFGDWCCQSAGWMEVSTEG